MINAGDDQGQIAGDLMPEGYYDNIPSVPTYDSSIGQINRENKYDSKAALEFYKKYYFAKNVLTDVNYKNAQNPPVLNDEDVFCDDRLSFWPDNSQEMLSEKFKDCTLDELIIELIDIFRGGSPSYRQLSIFFGYESTTETDQGDITKISFYKTKWSDICKIEMDIKKKSSDKTLVLRKLYLYVNDLASVDSLISKINEVYKDIRYEKNEGLIIHENESSIMILEGR